MSNFVVQALTGVPITLYGSGKQTRSFCYVEDLIEGLIRLMESPADFTGPVNLGNPNEFTIEDLALEILRQTGSKSELQFNPLPSDDPKQRRPDITLARTRLNWEPAVPLAEGLKPTIAYFGGVLIPEREKRPNGRAKPMMEARA